MKQIKFEKTFLEELAKAPIITNACNNVGLSRQTIYRWMECSSAFRKKVNDSIKSGISSINDLAESKLVKKIKQEDFQAIKYWLDNNKKNYIRPRTKDILGKLFDSDNKIGEVKSIIISAKDEIARLKELNENFKRKEDL
jgi:hypothetical protein